MGQQLPLSWSDTHVAHPDHIATVGGLLRTPILLFDLGGTLIEYFRRGEFAPLLADAISRTAAVVHQAGLAVPAVDVIERRVRAENREARNHRVRPPGAAPGTCLPAWRQSRSGPDALCRAFLMPAFAKARRYSDTLEVLRSYRQRGYGIGILSNCPWGSPAWAWHEELHRHGLHGHCDVALFCGEVGWRKPALPMFRAAVHSFACRAEECLFIGDDRVPIVPVLIDRTGNRRQHYRGTGHPLVPRPGADRGTEATARPRQLARSWSASKSPTSWNG